YRPLPTVATPDLRALRELNEHSYSPRPPAHPPSAPYDAFPAPPVRGERPPRVHRRTPHHRGRAHRAVRRVAGVLHRRYRPACGERTHRTVRIRAAGGLLRCG